MGGTGERRRHGALALHESSTAYRTRRAHRIGKEGTRQSSLAVGDGADIWARRDLIYLAGRHRYCARLLEFVFITMLGVEEKVNGV